MPEISRFVAPDFLALTIGIVVFFVGVLITQRVSFLRSYNIPEPVTGGFVAALAFWAVYGMFGLRVTRDDTGYRITGVAWGAPIEKVEVKVDDGPWQPATIDHTDEAEYAWKVWTFDWAAPTPGEHTITSRATDASGQIQPAMNDPWIAKKHTYWESNGQITRRINIS